MFINDVLACIAQNLKKDFLASNLKYIIQELVDNANRALAKLLGTIGSIKDALIRSGKDHSALSIKKALYFSADKMPKITAYGIMNSWKAVRYAGE